MKIQVFGLNFLLQSVIPNNGAPHGGKEKQSELSDETQQDPAIQIFKGNQVRESLVILSLQAAPIHHKVA